MNILTDRNKLVQRIAEICQSLGPDEELDYTLACNNDGTKYADQTGDNSFHGPAYSYPHWAVTTLTRYSHAWDEADYLLHQLSESLTTDVPDPVPEEAR
jgi:hypothetical protein